MEVKATNLDFKLEFIFEAKTIMLENTQTCQNQYYVFRMTFVSQKSESNHALHTWNNKNREWIHLNAWEVKTSALCIYNENITIKIPEL